MLDLVDLRAWPVETLTAQAKELAELGQKVATETVEPIKTASSKVFTKVA